MMLVKKTYRGDTRLPKVIKNSEKGFNARGTDLDLESHLNYSKDSGYISTSEDINVAKKFAENKGLMFKNNKSFLFEINLNNLNYINVNKVKPQNYFFTEKEIAILLKIPNQNILRYKIFDVKQQTWSKWYKF